MQERGDCTNGWWYGQALLQRRHLHHWAGADQRGLHRRDVGGTVSPAVPALPQLPTVHSRVPRHCCTILPFFFQVVDHTPRAARRCAYDCQRCTGSMLPLLKWAVGHTPAIPLCWVELLFYGHLYNAPLSLPKLQSWDELLKSACSLSLSLRESFYIYWQRAIPPFFLLHVLFPRLWRMNFFCCYGERRNIFWMIAQAWFQVWMQGTLSCSFLHFGETFVLKPSSGLSCIHQTYSFYFNVLWPHLWQAWHFTVEFRGMRMS